MKLTAALITLNEESNIGACLDTVSFADEMIVVDSESTDQTRRIAEERGAKVIIRPFDNFSNQKNEAVRQASGDWIFFIDADERVTPTLADELKEVVGTQLPEAAYAVHRLNFFLGVRMRFAGTGRDFPIRLFPRAKANFYQPIHEQVSTDLTVRRLRCPLEHFSTPDIEHYNRKLQQYTDLEAEFWQSQGKRIASWDLFLRPLGKFLLLYVVKLGFLDGVVGYRYAALSSYYDYIKLKKFMRLRGHDIPT